MRLSLELIIARSSLILAVLLTALAISPGAASARPQENPAWWVYLRDRGPAGEEAPAVPVDDHARERRRARGSLGAAGDFDRPVHPGYREQVLALPGVRLRGESRWLNALSVDADSASAAALRRLPCVEAVRPVRSLVPDARPSRDSMETFEGRSLNQRWSESLAAPDAIPDPYVLDPYWRMDRSWYGPSLNQVRMVNALETHFRGNHGQGVRIVVLDGGFQLNHEAFQHMDVIAQYDFINDDYDPSFDPAQDTEGQAHHGTACGSVIAGYSPGNLVGLAHEAAFILGKTEDDAGETPVEEDYWVRAVEWAEALGADVLSSSLSYKDWYTLADYDGLTAPTSRAANLAHDLGMVLCTSAGNEGPEAMTLGVPADAEGVLAIGAVRWDGDLARFSSRGPTADGRLKPDVLAQGVRTCCVSPDTWNRYGFWNGTSLSCPVAAGCMALIVAEHPDWSPGQVYEAVRETASRNLRPDSDWGWGIINVEEAIHYPSVSGWALDENGRGVPGVEIRLQGPDGEQTVTTDEEGFYRFSNLEEDEVQVRAVWDDGEASEWVTLDLPGSEELDFKK
ncbi:MAG: hypothetical protein C4524_01755 [Candidatus Zixiibacteriota bacterium]|nr:MAG: hypothetical protein C4524_01755 [candidate division Zixibacteria bacterium]